MVEKLTTPAQNVVDFVGYQLRRSGAATRIRACRHCGAALGDGESDDDCSTLMLCEQPTRIRRPQKF
ncbi:hypothetical protein [Rhodopseudomonas palustris]|uniref:hypothetical protein n=1 Tax=Rhodopseudomonas palustris TaxID=1076 RepID=UPI0002E54CAD